MMLAPETSYVEGPSGLIAYQVIGTGPDLVYLTGMTSNVDVRWEYPQFARLFTRIASFGRLILFDRRGTGASDPVPTDALPSWEQWSEDLRIVLDAVHSETAALIAVLDAGAMAMLFAAAQPSRTRALVLCNTSARLLQADDYPAGLSLEYAESLHTLIRERWGTAEFAAAMSPEFASDPAARAWFAKYQRASATPRVAAAHFRSMFDIDVRAALASIQAPTLILHRRAFPVVPLDHGRYLCEHIGGARLLELEGSDSLPLTDGDGLALDTVEEFLTGHARLPELDRVLTTCLFTDIVSSTTQAANVGDRRWKQLLDEHDELVRRELERHRGNQVKATGDGVLATFDGPARAIRCAQAILSGLRALGLEGRSGLHTGEIELRGDDIAGLAVVIAERVTSTAEAGQVLVSSTVRDLVVGSEVVFEDRGMYSLKGVPDRWRLFAVTS